jgi:hypothetical protein
MLKSAPVTLQEADAFHWSSLSETRVNPCCSSDTISKVFVELVTS